MFLAIWCFTHAFQELSPASKVVPSPSSTDIKIYFTEHKTPPKTSCQTQSISMALSPPFFSCCLSFLPTEIRRGKALCSRLRWSPSSLYALLSSLQSNERKEPFQIIQGTSLNKGKHGAQSYSCASLHVRVVCLRKADSSCWFFKTFWASSWSADLSKAFALCTNTCWLLKASVAACTLE